MTGPLFPDVILSMLKKLKSSLSYQIILAVILALTLGAFFPDAELKFMGEFGRVIIHWIKILAGPFLFLTVTLAVMETHIQAKQGLKLVLIALLNTTIAIIIGITLTKTFLSHIELSSLGLDHLANKNFDPTKAELGLSSWLKNLMPKSIFEPFFNNDILLIALFALLLGLALRKTFLDESTKFNKIAGSLETARALFMTFLKAVIFLVPFAVFAVVSSSVSEYGFSIFGSLIQYVAVVILGFILQVTLVYCFWVFVVCRLKFKDVMRALKEPIFYAWGVNSSLATLPLTLKALKDLKVSEKSSALGAGVATNLNNDGIVLYEALAVFFIAQLYHVPLEISQMAAIAFACIVAAMGITGIPEAGFISLSVVVSTFGLPTEILPLLLAVDWMIARGRSVVNVLSDMTLSIAMDGPKRSRHTS